VIIDDSIVRSTTISILIKMIRQAAAANKQAIEIIIGVVSPPIRFPCYYGIDMPTKEELAASDYESEVAGKFMAKKIGADAVYYLSYAGLKLVINEMGADAGKYCYACFDGQYKIPLV
jgi:amidophosphoribosyltransferase